ncbi:hypoxanthine phosphoribosyltransferase [Carboxydochorda subterranea]|uniref:Hypoxanthine phosphoribosyltransferase n=1 Tax=Carboxydichorda subterranea TaxID=3109565 RepID=A0ABZ1BU76_9FIRM|nr:hypoxanthine phosphoribosyltransferase [Limnochorda sp. L945t]WRP16375.1 hypoxanthine phosphoribosyltransferase [Limnochorda sp. L945t]
MRSLEAEASPLLGDIESVLLEEARIRQRVQELGHQISHEYKDLDPLFVGILKGAVLFLSDLLRAVSIPSTVDFMAISSYGAGTKSSGVVRILKDLDHPIADRHVIIVEDIVDTGLTLRYLLDNLQSRKPASLRVCVLLDKSEQRQLPVHLDYVGFSIPNRFVVGYGLDYAEHYRNLPFIGILSPEAVQRGSR